MLAAIFFYSLFALCLGAWMVVAGHDGGWGLVASGVTLVFLVLARP